VLPLPEGKQPIEKKSGDRRWHRCVLTRRRASIATHYLQILEEEWDGEESVSGEERRN